MKRPVKAPAKSPGPATPAKRRTKAAPAEPVSARQEAAPKRASAPKRTSVAKPARARKPPAGETLAQIRQLESQLDALIGHASDPSLGALELDDVDEVDGEDEAVTEAHASVPEAPHEQEAVTPRVVPTPRPSGPLPSQAESAADGSTADSDRELLGADFYARRWGRVAMRSRSEEVDDFGYDPSYDAKLRPLLDFLYARYFRVETSGMHHVPAEGRAILVSNHSGTVPLDGVMLKTALRRVHARSRPLRWLTEDFIHHFPFLGGAMCRLGAVRACQENAERLLANEELVAVFPEGVKGIGKLFSDRYRLQRFGRGGFVRLALRSRAPLVPVAIVGAEETNPLLFRIEVLSKALGLPYLPVTPTFPALGPLGLLPAPTKWRIVVGEPIDISSHGEGAADDELLVGRIADRVRATIQGMLDREIGARKSVFFG